MRLRRSFALVTLVAAGAFAACTLNPQPLPPGPEENARASDANDAAAADGGAFGTPNAPPQVSDASPGALDGEAGPSSDGGDAEADAADAADGG